jgi:opacity protein-like surface antigen
MVLNKVRFLMGVVVLMSWQSNVWALSSWKKNAWASSEDAAPAYGVAPERERHDRERDRERVDRGDRGEKYLPFSPATHNIGLDLGQVFLMGDLTRFSDSIGVRVHYTYGVSNLVGFDAMLGYSEHSDGDLSLVSLLSGLRFNIPWYDRVLPYALVGLGFYRPSYRDHFSQGAPVTSSTRIHPLLFGLHFGGGFELLVNQNVFFGVGLTIQNMFSVTETYSNNESFSAGGIYGSLLLNAGFTFLGS